MKLEGNSAQWADYPGMPIAHVISTFMSLFDYALPSESAVWMVSN